VQLSELFEEELLLPPMTEQAASTVSVNLLLDEAAPRQAIRAILFCLINLL
jgi:hypothetical protein